MAEHHRKAGQAGRGYGKARSVRGLPKTPARVSAYYAACSRQSWRDRKPRETKEEAHIRIMKELGDETEY